MVFMVKSGQITANGKTIELSWDGKDLVVQTHYASIAIVTSLNDPDQSSVSGNVVIKFIDGGLDKESSAKVANRS